MKFMVIVKATADSEAGIMPSEQLLADMTSFNEELVATGKMITGEGLFDSSHGARIEMNGSERTVVPGPFGNTTELIAGFWLMNADSLDDAIAWMKKFPNPAGEKGQLEIRRVFDAADFGEAFTPELQEREAVLREKLAGN